MVEMPLTPEQEARLREIVREVMDEPRQSDPDFLDRVLRQSEERIRQRYGLVPRPVPIDSAFDAFFTAWLAADERHLTDGKGPARRAWDELTLDERSRAADGIAAFLDAQRRAGRLLPVSPATYLRDRRFERVTSAPVA